MWNPCCRGTSSQGGVGGGQELAPLASSKVSNSSTRGIWEQGFCQSNLGVTFGGNRICLHLQHCGKCDGKSSEWGVLGWGWGVRGLGRGLLGAP